MTTTTTTSSSAGPPGTTAVIINTGNDSAFAPLSFRGADSEDAGAWLQRFEKYIVYRGSSDADKLHLLALLLQDAAGDWYVGLNDEIKTDFACKYPASTNFERRFQTAFRGHRGSAMAQSQRTTSTCPMTNEKY